MSCCGQKRALFTAPGRSLGTKHAPRPTQRSVIYEYTGLTAMTVQGPVSGQTYRFAQPGARVHIDARDIVAITGIPNLRRSK